MSSSGKLKMKIRNQFQNILFETVLLFSFARGVNMGRNGEGELQELHCTKSGKKESAVVWSKMIILTESELIKEWRRKMFRGEVIS